MASLVLTKYPAGASWHVEDPSSGEKLPGEQAVG